MNDTEGFQKPTTLLANSADSLIVSDYGDMAEYILSARYVLYFNTRCNLEYNLITLVNSPWFSQC